MGVGKGAVGISRRANGKDTVAGLVGQKAHRIGPFRGVLRQNKDSSELVHAMLFVRLNTFLAERGVSINFRLSGRRKDVLGLTEAPSPNAEFRAEMHPATRETTREDVVRTHIYVCRRVEGAA